MCESSKKFFFVLLFIAATCYLSWTADAGAQNRAADEKKKLEKVKEMFKSPYTEEDYYRTDRLLMTATGSQLPIHKAPAVASIITAEDIEKMGATSLDDVLETVPGLHVVPSFDRMSSMYSIRGIHTNTNPQVLLLINGIPITQTLHGHRVSTLRLPIASISRVEVIRGPGSAVHGADAFAGTINIITKDSHELKTFKSGARAGSFNTYDTWIQGGGTWNGWDVSLNLEYSTSDGDNDRIVDTDLQTAIDATFGTSVSNAPGALNTSYNILNTNLGFRKGNWNARMWFWQQNDAGVGTNSDNVLEPDSWQDAKQFLADISYEDDKVAQDWEVTASLNYMYIDDDVYFILFPAGSTLLIGSDGNLFTSGGGVVSFPDGVIGHPRAREDHYGLDFVTKYTGIRDHRFRFGAGAKHISIDSSELKNFGPGIIDGTQPVVDGTLTDVSDTEYVYIKDETRDILYASFQDEWSFASGWEFTAGIRFDKYSDFGNTINPRLALVWETHYTLTTKLLYGRAFRPPSFGELYLINNPAGLGNPDLEPEKIQTYELALDYQPLSKLRCIFNLFMYEIKDLIEYVQDPGASTLTAQNTKEQRGRGFEIEIDWEIADSFRLRSNYAYQHSEDKNTNASISDAPRQQIYINPHWAFLHNWSMDFQYLWIGDRKRTASDTRTEIDDYSIANLTLRRKKIFKSWDMALSVKNLFDADIREPAPSSITNDYPMPGRSLFVELRYSY